MKNEQQVPGAGQQVCFSFAADFNPVEVSAKLPELSSLTGVLEVRLLEQEAQLQINFDEELISLSAIEETIKSLGLATSGYYLSNSSSQATAAGGLSSREFSVGGMTCTGCEQRLERVLKKIAGVTEVKADYTTGKVRLTCLTETPSETFIAAIEKLGYTAVLTPGLAASRAADSKANNKFNVMQLVGIGIILVAVWLILNQLGVFNMLPQVNSSMGYGLIFVVGLITSLHCLAMCGGINLSQSIAKGEFLEENEPVKTRITMSQFIPGLLYNTGRVISYTLVGGIVGSLGSLISFSQGLQGVIVLITGFFMVLMGINMLDVIPALRRFTIRMPKFLGRIAERNSSRGPLVVGLLNGLMPCGPLQSMQLYALGTGSFWAGALSMFLFSIGTVPLMLGFSMVSSLLNKRFTHRMLKISALLVLLLGTAMVGRGLSLSGFSFKNISTGASHNVARIEGGKQYVTSSLTNNSYEPIFVQAGIPVEWTITATDDNLNGCNNPIIIPKYNIKKELVAGENHIQFTPAESGTIPFSCWMGMINSGIKVVEDISKIDDSTKQQAQSMQRSSSCASSSNGGGGGCCGGGGGNPDGFIQQTEPINIPLDNIQIAKIKGDTQYIDIDVDRKGYSPAAVIAQKGLATKINFRGLSLDDENYRMLVPAYGARLELKEGDNTVDFTTVGDFYFVSWHNVYRGFVKIVADLKQVDVENVRTEIKNYKIPSF